MVKAAWVVKQYIGLVIEKEILFTYCLASLFLFFNSNIESLGA